MNECVIKVEHLKKSFETVTPLKDVNVEINKGDIISIIGPSGTGKSTFLRCLNLLTPPTEGIITICGEQITEKNADVSRIRQKMGMVFQSYNLFNHLSVVENVMVGPVDMLKKPKQEAYDNAIKILENMGLKKQAFQYPDSLSGGQKQRVAIARAIAMNPEILLLDEPTSALDPAMIQEIEIVLQKLALSGITMIIVTHEMNLAKLISNRIFYMDQGIIYEDGTPEQIFENPQKERTIQFIDHFKLFEICFNQNNFDFDDIFVRLSQFTTNNGLPKQVSYSLYGLIDEIVSASLLTNVKDAIDIKVSLQIVKKQIHMTIEYGGQELNPLNNIHIYSQQIINKIAECTYEYKNNLNMIIAILKDEI